MRSTGHFWRQAFSHPGPEVLVRPRSLSLELESGAKRPVRITQELAGHDNEVQLAGSKDVVRLLGRGDQAERAGEDARFAADAFRKSGLIPGPKGMSALATLPPEEQSIRSTPSAFRVRASSTDCSMSQPPSTQSVADTLTKSGRRFRPDLPHGGGNLPREPHSVLKGTAVFVGPSVGERGKELVQEVSVRRIDIQGLEPAASALLAAAVKSSTTWETPWRDSSSGTV